MQYYPFSVAVGVSHHVLARGNFLRYYEALTGTANPTLEIKPMGSGGAGSSEFLLRPGQSIKLPTSVPGFMIENFDGIATITGRLLVGEGDFNDSVISGEVTIVGDADVNLAIGTGQNDQSESTVTTARSNVYGGGTTRRRCVFYSLASNTDDIVLGGAAVTTSNYAIRLAPGESWEDWIGGSASFFALSISGSQKLRCTYLT